MRCVMPPATRPECPARPDQSGNGLTQSASEPGAPALSERDRTGGRFP
jgi:hypothetical protein